MIPRRGVVSVAQIAALLAELPGRLVRAAIFGIVVVIAALIAIALLRRLFSPSLPFQWALVAAAVAAFFELRAYMGLLLTLLLSLSKLAAVHIYVPLRAAIVLFWDMRWICFAVLVTVAIIYDYYLRWTPTKPPSYTAIYLAEFGGILSFTAITIAISIWKQSATEGRLLLQGTNLRDDLLQAVDQYEGQTGEDHASIAVKGLAETLNEALFAPSAFDEPRYDRWRNDVFRHPLPTLKPITLVATLQVKVPFVNMIVWRKAVWGALHFAVYAALTNLALAMIGDASATWFALLVSIASVVIGLRATLRLVA